ncbi:MAG: YlxM family DNA-binding protein [Erysipelotrichaceae bacterium]
MEKFEYINELMPFYQSLLTARQNEILQYYYFEDLSITEIADLLSISRNAVHDALKKSVNLVNKYEDKLGLCSLYKKRMKLFGKLKSLENKQVDDIVDELINMEDQ